MKRLVDRERRRLVLTEALAFGDGRRVDVVAALAASAGISVEQAQQSARRLRVEARRRR